MIIVNAFNAILQVEHVFRLSHPVHVLHRGNSGLLIHPAGNEDADAVGGIVLVKGVAVRIHEGVNRDPLGVLAHVLLHLIAVIGPNLRGTLDVEARVALVQIAVADVAVINGEILRDQTLIVQGIQQTIGLLRAGHLLVIQGVPVLLGDLGEVQEGIHDHGGGEQRAVLIQLHGVGNRLLAAQLGFLGRAQIGNPLLGGGRLRHVQLVQPVLADEQTELGHIDAAGRDIISQKDHIDGDGNNLFSLSARHPP